MSKKKLDNYMFFLLICFLTFFIWTSQGWGISCADTIELKNSDFSSCEDFCKNNVKQASDIPGDDIPGGFTIQGFGINKNDVQSINPICGCVFYRKTDDDVYTDTLYCSYQIHLREKGKKVATLDDLNINNLATNLVRLAVFDGKAAYPNFSQESGVIFKGLYTIYIHAIQGLLYFSALVFTIIVFGWFFFFTSISKLTDVLKEKGNLSWSFFTSAEVKAKAAATLLAVSLFSFPVSISKLPGNSNQTIAVNSNAVFNPCEEIQEEIDQAQKNKNYFSQQCEDNNQGDKSSIDECKLSVEQYFNQQINALTTDLRTCQNPNNTAYSNSTFNNSQNNEEEFLNDTYDENSTVNKKAWISKEVKLPAIIVLVRSFIMWGNGLAEKVDAVVRDIIEQYIKIKVNKMLKGSFAFQEQATLEKQRYEKDLNTIFSNINAGKFKDCAELLDNANNIDGKLQNDPEAYLQFQTAIDICKQLKELKMKGQEQQNQQQEQQDNRNKQIIQNLSDSMDKAGKQFGWLGSAVMPLYSIVGIIASAGQGEGVKVKATLLEEKGKGLFATTVGSLDEGLVYSDGSFGRNVSSALSMGYHVVKQGFKTAALNIKNEYGWGFFLGSTIVLGVTPPGEMVYNVIKDVVDKVGNFLTVLIEVATAIFGLSGGFVGSLIGLGAAVIVGDIIAPVLGKVVGLIYGSFFTMITFYLAPMIVVAFALFLRFLAYLFDIIRFVLALPFFAIVAATRDSTRVLLFFQYLGQLVFYPLLISFSAVVAFFGVELIRLIFFEVPFALISQFVSSTFVGGFLLGVFAAILFLASSIIASMMAWNLAYGFSEKCIMMVSHIFAPFTSIAPRFEEVKGVVTKLGVAKGV